jgi:hypothetical protein
MASASVRTIVNNDETIPSGLSDDEIKARIMKYIAEPPRNSRVIRITAKVAAWVLDTYNLHNRSMKPKSISRFSRHMGAGTWGLTGDNLKFSDRGLLRDGQNRLRACVRSGKPFTTHVVFGIKDELFDRIDQGKPRSGGDVLTIAGYPNANVLSGAARWVRNLSSADRTSRNAVEPDEALQLIRDEFPTLPDYVSQAGAIYRTTRQPMTLVTALLYLFAQANRAKSEEFATAWADGKHGGRYKSIGLLEQAIARIRADAMGRVHDLNRCALIVTAWNLFVTGKRGTISQMKWTPGDPMPEIAR